MSFERPTEAAAGHPAEASPVPTPAIRLQILSTEHWSLLASRSLAWNESFSRAGMFLSTLSGSIVALALVAQATAFGEGFRIFGLVILPVVLFIGIGTTLRMGIANYHDAICVMGMNRIRSGYLEFAPDVGRFFVMGTTDDQRGMSMTMAVEPRTSMVVQMLASSPMLISIVNSVLAGAISALVALQLGTGTAAAFAAGILGFIVALGSSLAYARREIIRSRGMFERHLPTPPPSGGEAPAT